MRILNPAHQPCSDTTYSHTNRHHHQDQPQDTGLWVSPVVEDGEDGRADHDADHEAWEDHAQWGAAGVKNWSPEEYKYIHTWLQESLGRS